MEERETDHPMRSCVEILDLLQAHVGDRNAEDRGEA
jgi:hypothetical protein